MRLKIIFLYVSFFIVLSIKGQNNEKEVFTDSLTSVQLYFPKYTEFKNVSFKAFKKATAVLEKSYISIYSMKNPEGEQYSWIRINEFDDKDQYGHLIKSEKIKDVAEGWFRYYQNETKNGKTYITCVTLIRGNIYAFYLVETAYKEEFLSSKKVVTSSVFPNSKSPDRKRTNTMSDIDWGIFCIILLSGLCFWKVKSTMSDSIKLILVVLSSAILVVYLIFYVWLTIWSSIFLGFLNGAFWFICLFSKSWSDFFNSLEKTLNKLSS